MDMPYGSILVQIYYLYTPVFEQILKEFVLALSTSTSTMSRSYVRLKIGWSARTFFLELQRHIKARDLTANLITLQATANEFVFLHL